MLDLGRFGEQLNKLFAIVDAYFVLVGRGGEVHSITIPEAPLAPLHGIFAEKAGNAMLHVQKNITAQKTGKYRLTH